MNTDLNLTGTLDDLLTSVLGVTWPPNEPEE